MVLVIIRQKSQIGNVVAGGPHIHPLVRSEVTPWVDCGPQCPHKPAVSLWYHTSHIETSFCFCCGELWRKKIQIGDSASLDMWQEGKAFYSYTSIFFCTVSLPLSVVCRRFCYLYPARPVAFLSTSLSPIFFHLPRIQVCKLYLNL